MDKIILEMKQITLLTKEDLQEFKIDLLKSIEEKLVDLLEDSTLNKKWLRTNEVAEYLSISSSQVNKLKSEGILSCSKLGGTNFFDRKELDKKLEEGLE